jgi:hypothetical protein
MRGFYSSLDKRKGGKAELPKKFCLVIFSMSVRTALVDHRQSPQPIQLQTSPHRRKTNIHHHHLMNRRPGHNWKMGIEKKALIIEVSLKPTLLVS